MKIGLVGYGRWGAGYVARNIARVADLAVISDPDPERCSAALSEWGSWGTRVATEADVAIANCDAIWVATPASTHSGIVADALAAGKHVLCEKPFVLRSDEAEELCEEAEENGLVLMIGHLSLYTSHHKNCKDRKVSQEMQYDYKAAEMHGPWRVHVDAHRRTLRPSLSDHSVLWGLGPHDFAAAIDLIGDITSVSAEGNQHRVKVVLEAGSSTANIELDWLSQEKERKFEVHTNIGELAGKKISADMQEPLLAEAYDFVRMCSQLVGEDLESQRTMAVNVTSALAAAEHCLRPVLA